jgi:hypothetical protein
MVTAIVVGHRHLQDALLSAIFPEAHHAAASEPLPSIDLLPSPRYPSATAGLSASTPTTAAAAPTSTTMAAATAMEGPWVRADGTVALNWIVHTINLPEHRGQEYYFGRTRFLKLYFATGEPSAADLAALVPHCHVALVLLDGASDASWTALHATMNDERIPVEWPVHVVSMGTTTTTTAAATDLDGVSGSSGRSGESSTGVSSAASALHQSVRHAWDLTVQDVGARPSAADVHAVCHHVLDCVAHPTRHQRTLKSRQRKAWVQSTAVVAGTVVLGAVCWWAWRAYAARESAPTPPPAPPPVAAAAPPAAADEVGWPTVVGDASAKARAWMRDLLS